MTLIEMERLLVKLVQRNAVSMDYALETYKRFSKQPNIWMARILMRDYRRGAPKQTGT